MVPTNLQKPIAEWYKSCMVILNAICQALEDIESESDHEPVAKPDYRKVLILVQDEIGRLCVWAGNMGAHRTGRMSLDHKLREATHIKKRVVKLLEELDGLLQEFLDEIKGDPLSDIEEGDEGQDKEPEDEDVVEKEKEKKEKEKEETGGDNAHVELSRQDHDCEEPEIDSSTSDGDTKISNLIFMLNDIAHIITCLYNLSAVMSQPVPRDRLQKYAQIDVRHYEFYDVQHVQEKFPLGPAYLIKRLAHSNTHRRQYFEYRKQHHEKIAKGAENILGGTGEDSKDAKTIITTAKTSTTVSTIPGSTPLQTQSAFDLVDGESDGGHTATSFGTNMEPDSESSIAVPRLKVPDLHNADHAFAGNAFECPYCYTLTIVRNTKAWWRHVFKDLQPYVCTFEICAKPNHLFGSRHEWWTHELQYHRREWFCAQCNQSSSTAEEFIRHLKRDHDSLCANEEQLSEVTRNCERAFEGHQQCPLCKIILPPRRLRSHISGHMRQVALFTLPKLDTEDGEDEDEANSMEDERREEGAQPEGEEPESSDGEEDWDVEEVSFNHSRSAGALGVDFHSSLYGKGDNEVEVTKMPSTQVFSSESSANEPSLGAPTTPPIIHRTRPPLKRILLERLRLARQRKLERERLEREWLERERLGRGRLERERLERERLERERLERERERELELELERVRVERVQKERLERERPKRPKRLEWLERTLDLQSESGWNS